MKGQLDLSEFLNHCQLISVIYDESFGDLEFDDDLIGDKNIQRHLKSRNITSNDLPKQIRRHQVNHRKKLLH